MNITHYDYNSFVGTTCTRCITHHARWSGGVEMELQPWLIRLNQLCRKYGRDDVISSLSDNNKPTDHLTEEDLENHPLNCHGFGFRSLINELIKKKQLSPNCLWDEKKLVCLRQLQRGNYYCTKYWKQVRTVVREKYGCCQKCSSTKNLKTHHITYDNIGDELNHLEDIILLCLSCHNSEHRRAK